MISVTKAGIALAAGLTGAAIPCPDCASEAGTTAAVSARTGNEMQGAQQAELRLQITGMACGSCSSVAQLALSRMSGVQSATVTHENSLAVVRYDPSRVEPGEIASSFSRLTGYAAKVLPDAPGNARHAQHA